MKGFLLFTVLLIVSAFLVSCSNSESKTEADVIANDNAIAETDDFTAVDEDTVVPDSTEAEIADNDAVSGFNPDNPGYNIFFQIMLIDFVQPSAMSFGTIMKAAREDLNPSDTANKPPLDTCVFETTQTQTPTCTKKEDCAPEQECVPSYDNNNKPIAGSEHCETPGRVSLDMGPMTVTGFTTSPQTFAFEPNDKVYKLNGTGDGSIDIALLAFGAEYTVTFPGKDDLGAFTGTATFQPKFALTFPPTTLNQFQMPVITTDKTQDLVIKWDGSNPGKTMDFTMAGKNGSVVCNVSDDGEFTVPKDLFSQLELGTGMEAFGNMITISRKDSQKITGENVTAGAFGVEQLITLNFQ